VELGRDPDRREEAEGNLTATTRSAQLVLTLALVAGLFMVGGAAAAPAGKCTLARVAEWPVRPGRAQPIIDGTINGQKVGIMLDTGASRSIILRSAADRLGLVRHNARGNRMIGIGGETDVESVTIEELAIGTDVRRSWRVLVAGEQTFRGDVALILGEDLLRQSDVEFDLAHNAVRLYQARDCDGVPLAYWATEGTGVVELGGIFAAGPALELAVEINGRPVDAILDSGASSSVLTLSRAAALGVTPASAGVVAAGCSRGLGEKPIDVWLGPFESFRIGDELIRDPTIGFSDIWKFSTFRTSGSLISKRPSSRPDMLLGADFLRSHRVLIAHSQRKMYFTYAGGTVFPVSVAKPCAEAPPSGASPGTN
jgi:gag-polyprotein putative aspartyl protease/aspartyl protease